MDILWSQSETRPAELLELLLDGSPATIRYYEAVRDEQDQIIDFVVRMGNDVPNQPYLKPLTDVLGRRLVDLYPNVIKSGFFDRYIKVVETGITDRFEIHYNADGINGWFYCTAVASANGFVLTSLDITELKETQLAREQQADLFAGIMKTAPSAVTVFEAIRDKHNSIIDFRVTLCNKAASQLASRVLNKAVEPESLVGLTLKVLYPSTEQDGIFQQLVDVVTTAQSTSFIRDYASHDATFELSVSKFRDGIIICSNDISASRNYQRELELKNQELKRSNQALEQFAYAASHDLQEPLRKIETFGDLLLHQYANQLDATGADLLRRMQVASQRMSGMIRDLLHYSRTFTPKNHLEAVDLNLLMQDITVDLEGDIKDKQAIIQFASLPIVRGDRPQYRQLFFHLINNALKFTRPNTIPSVTISGRIVCGLGLRQRYPEANAPSFWEITVQDNGIGFEPKFNERIFQLFQRLHGRTQYQGSGIGLAICKKVVENHQGFIEAQGQLGQGATFTIYLPGE